MGVEDVTRGEEVVGELIAGAALPENCSPSALAESANYLKPKFAEAVDAGTNKVVIDIQRLRSLHMGVIKLLFQAMQTCRELAMQFALVGNPHIISECKDFEDTRSWTFYDSLEEAKANLGKPAGGAAAPAAPQFANA